MKKIDELVTILKEANENNVWHKTITAYGYQFDYDTVVYASVSKYWFGKNEIEEFICPLNFESDNNNRPGTKKESTEYITVHDTASSKDTADEYAHAKYVTNGGGGTSWHYSVGSKMACHQVPDDEVAYHAGDSLDVRFELFNTNVSGTNKNPTITINDGFYYIDGIKSSIKVPQVSFEYRNDELVYASDGVKQGRKAPKDAKEGRTDIVLTTADINDAGIRIDLKGDGYYYIGPTYYNASFGKIANRGGNLNSIGIETMINQGSNLMRTWHRCAKLVANLLVDNNLDPSRVKPHHFFSGKPCPNTLRTNGLWNYFMECVNTEYKIRKDFSDIKIELINHSQGLLEDGLIDQDHLNNNVSYTVKLTDDKETRIIELHNKVE